MRLDELFRLVEARGCTLSLGADGAPRLAGDRARLTPALLRVLRLRREEIIARLRPRPPELFAWAWDEARQLYFRRRWDDDGARWVTLDDEGMPWLGYRKPGPNDAPDAPPPTP